MRQAIEEGFILDVLKNNRRGNRSMVCSQVIGLAREAVTPG